MFTAFFQEERHIGELTVLTELAGELGFDTLKFRTALETGRYRKRHREALRHAREEMRITAVPTFVSGHNRLQGHVHTMNRVKEGGERFITQY
jgi:predicted DsbA family dithiol-disulfide isomerase